MRAAIAKSVPFERFRVERALDGGDTSTPEGQDSILDALRPIFSELPASAMRMELTRMVSSRLAVPDSLLDERMASRGASRRRIQPGITQAENVRGEGRRDGPLSRRGDTERAFLALCIASPQEGAVALEGLDVDEHFSSDLLRRAARHLCNGDLREPMRDSAGGDGGLENDPELKGLLAELVVEAGREQSEPAMLEVQRLQLELARVDRQIQRARGQESGEVSDLALRRTEVKREFDRAYGRALEETGG